MESTPAHESDGRERCIHRLVSGDVERGGKPSLSALLEAEAVVAGARAGLLPKPIERPTRGDGHSGDFVDGDGRDWDVKSEMSRSILRAKIQADRAASGRPALQIPADQRLKGEFELEKVMQDIQRDIDAGESLLFDLRALTEADAEALTQAIADRQLTDHVAVLAVKDFH